MRPAEQVGKEKGMRTGDARQSEGGRQEGREKDMQSTSEQYSDRTIRQDRKVERPAACQKRVCSPGQAF